MGEAGVPDAVIKAIAGHVSQAMLERYSHARREAKRAAVEAMSLTKAVPKEVPIVARLAVVK